MKPRNFPASKLIRQLIAKGIPILTRPIDIGNARDIRTKKYRGNK